MSLFLTPSKSCHTHDNCNDILLKIIKYVNKVIDVVIVLNEGGCTYGNIMYAQALLDISKVNEKFRDKNLKIFLII